MKFFRLALVALALVASVAIAGCKSEEATTTPPAGDAAPTAPADGAAK